MSEFSEEKSEPVALSAETEPAAQAAQTEPTAPGDAAPMLGRVNEAPGDALHEPAAGGSAAEKGKPAATAARVNQEARSTLPHDIGTRAELWLGRSVPVRCNCSSRLFLTVLGDKLRTAR